MNIFRFIICTTILLSSYTAYNTIGIQNRRPFIGDCMKLENDCVSCIRLGCFFYKLNPIINKNVCYPSYLQAPLNFLVETAIVNDDNCTFQPDQPKTNPPNQIMTSTKGPPKQPEGSNLIAYVIAIAILGCALLAGIGLYCYKRCANRPILGINRPQ